MAERNVCMRVCRHGCVVKKFCFSRANHAKLEFEKVFELKTRQVYFIYPFLRRLKLGKSLQRRAVIFFALNLTFSARKVRILESIFLQNKKLITRARLHGQDFATGKNFAFNRSDTKSFASLLGKGIL